jgi:hypothetical protein
MNLQSFYKFRKRFLFIVCLSLLSAILLISLSPESQKENFTFHIGHLLLII